MAKNANNNDSAGFYDPPPAFHEASKYLCCNTVRIFDYIIGGTVDCFNPRTLPIRLRGVSKGWFNYIAYHDSHFRFDGDANEIEDVWDFLEEVVSKPCRALEIRQLSFTTVKLWEKFNPLDVRHVLLTTFRHGDRYLRQPRGAAKASNQPAVADDDDTIYDWLAREYVDGDGLIQSVTGLGKLTVHIWPEEDDPWLRRVIDYAVGRKGFETFHNLNLIPLRKLRVIHAGAKVRRSGNRLPVAEGPFYITDVKLPFIRLPELKEAVLHHVEVDADFSLIPKTVENHSKIEKLLLNGPLNLRLRIPTWLALSPRLRQLTIRIPGDESAFHPPEEILETTEPALRWENIGPGRWSELWNMLWHFRKQLEYLDLLFPALRHLTITAPILGGYKCIHPTPTRLRSHLPPNVETLGIYAENLQWICGTLADHVAVEEEIRGIIADARELRCLIVDCGLGSPTIDDFNLARADATAKGIQFREEGHLTMFYGGKGTWIGRSIMENADEVTVAYDGAMQAEQVIPRGLEVHGFEGELRDTRVMPAQAAAARDNGEDEDKDDDAVDFMDANE
ncbi:hypothetical protein BJY01DRAFT_248448 [Aspergillus pseudoustus]|uniref:F-box domain-containing protein n=1 Tax=Aspergillus pseudoustus TaxID=1810923 RepID=A0ABR4JV07_9EURO